MSKFVRCDITETATDRESVESAALVSSVVEVGDSTFVQNSVTYLPAHVIIRTRQPFSFHTVDKTSHCMKTSREVK
jgi:hypothetical protein